MIIQNVKSNIKFEVTKSEFEAIVSQGVAYKYRVIEDDSPIEVKSLRAQITEEKKIKPKK